MDKQDFLLEIGCEELPIGSLKPMVKGLSDAIAAEFSSAHLTHKDIQCYTTPRRLAVLVADVDIHQPARTIERFGPNVRSAYDKGGMPTLACLGFARTCGVSTDQLKTKETDKGKRVFAEIQESGKRTIDLLPTLVTDAIKKLPIKKSMRWGSHDFSFIRPVHWVVMLFGQNVVPAHILGQRTSRETQGHRFHHPQPIPIAQPKDYNALLYSQGYVIADFQARKDLIRKLITAAAGARSRVIINEALLDDVTALVEWPIALKGEFNPDFLTLPKEVLITSMQTHQKCFAVEDEQDMLKPHFILVSNIESKDPQTVIRGNERVINARLSDANFFYKNDLKQTLEERLPRLEHVVFQNKLGSLADKARRIASLASFIAQAVGTNADLAHRAALLCKCDLVSEMVIEFPTLQGIMGYYYALADEESNECAIAIKEHYMPHHSGDELAEGLVSCSVALADRLDTLIGILGVNLTPTGDKDPFALRRAAHGIFRMLIEKQLPLDLMTLLTQAQQSYAVKLPNETVTEQAFTFIMARLKAWYLEQGISPEVFEAVMARNPTVLLDFHHRILAVIQFQTLPEAKALAAANKRVSNILKKQAQVQLPKKTNADLFEFDAERELASQLEKQSQSLDSLNYTQALSQLSTLKEVVDLFFDEVMIMVDDEKIRNNRLALLASLRTLFSKVADISLL